jgi:hypothetical protein
MKIINGGSRNPGMYGSDKSIRLIIFSLLTEIHEKFKITFNILPFGYIHPDTGTGSRKPKKISIPWS